MAVPPQRRDGRGERAVLAFLECDEVVAVSDAHMTLEAATARSTVASRQASRRAGGATVARLRNRSPARLLACARVAARPPQGETLTHGAELEVVETYGGG